MAQDNFITRIITLAFIAVLFLIALVMLKSIIISIIIGLLLAYLFYPVYQKIYKYTKRENLSAILLIIGIFVVIAVPFWFILPALIKQTFETFLFFQKINFAQILEKILPSLSAETLRVFAINLNNFIAQLFSSLLNQFSQLIVELPSIILQLVIIFFTFYFAVRDADKLKQYALKLSPFSHSTEEKLLNKFRQITDSIIFGQLLIAIIQGIALGIGLFILGVSKVFILMFITIFVSMIPVLGACFVWLPVGIALLLSGSIFQGIILLLYGALIVSNIDNVLRPYFLSRKSELPIVVGIIGIIGGLYTFGIVGLVLGPLILAYLLIVIDFYQQGKLKELFKK